MKVFRSDQGGESVDAEFTDHLIKNGIVSQLSTPSIERKNMILSDMVGSMMNYSSLLRFSYVINTTVDILNVVLSKSISRIPLEL